MAGRKPIYDEPMIRRTYQINAEFDRFVKHAARIWECGESAALRYIVENAGRVGVEKGGRAVRAPKPS